MIAGYHSNRLWDYDKCCYSEWLPILLVLKGTNLKMTNISSVVTTYEDAA